MRTAGLFEQDTPVPDGQAFLTALDFAGGAVATVLAGMPVVVVPASSTVTGSFSVVGQILRTGIFATNVVATSLSQQAFGTANGPGPSSVAGTSGPNAIFGRPPIVGAKLPTLIGPQTGSKPLKGFQINTLDFIYAVGTLAATSITGGLNRLICPAAGGAGAFTIFNDIAPTALAVTLTPGGQLQRARITNPTPVMYATDGTILSIPMVITTPATSTVTIYGVILGCSFNYN